MLDFFGLGGTIMHHEDPERGIWFGEQNIVHVVPYYNPWCWMNPQAVAYVDEIIDVLIDHCQLPEDIPIVSSGLSMGGLCALVYTAKAKRTPAACVANCPVCDLPYHFTERPDLPRTLYSAFYHEEGTVEEVLQRFSPLHLAESMPDVPYYIFHCDMDKAVNKELHSDRLIERLKKNHTVTYHIVPGRGHCDLTDEMKELYLRYIADSILND